MSDVDELFDDEVDDEQQQQQQPGSPEEQQQQADGGDGSFEELEDDMADEQPAAAADGDGLEEADLFGSDDDDEAAGAAAADEPLGEPIAVSAPLLQRPSSRQLLLMKVPNIIKVDPQPYDPATTEVEPELMVEPSGKRKLRPNDINVVRWRYRQNEDGTLSRESNARYVQWSDGSESIMLGDELLTMDRQQQPRANTYLHVVRYDAIQGLSHIKQTAHLKPASLDSKLHQRLKMTVQKSTQKADKVQVHLAARNPEQEKLEAEKRAEEMARLRRSQARVTERVRAPKQRVPAFNAAYIEQDEEDEEAYFGRDAGDADEDDYFRRPQDDDEGAARLQSAKRSSPPPAAQRSAKQPRVERQQQGMEVDEGVEEEEGAPEAAKAAPGLKVRRGAILDDEDDD